MSALFPGLEAVPVAESGSDVAYTPDAVARACVAYLSANGGIPGTWWEPAAGEGAWLPALQEVSPGIATELDPNALSVRLGFALCRDALKGPPQPWVQSVVTNPPPSLPPSSRHRRLHES